MKMCKGNETEVTECVHVRVVAKRFESKKKFQEWIKDAGTSYWFGEESQRDTIDGYHVVIEKTRDDFYHVCTCDAGIYLMNDQGKTIDILNVH